MSIDAVWGHPAIVTNAVLTLVWVLAVAILRAAILGFIGHFDSASAASQLRRRVQVRWASLFLLLAGLGAIWATELSAVVVSLLAVAVAIVLATKELILCISGAIVRTSSESFSVGDRVEIGSFRGDVIDLRLLTTSLLEVGAGDRKTGRTIVLPNSMLLTAGVVNETLTDEYVLHTFTIHIEDPTNWQAKESALIDVANRVCAEHIEPARRMIDRMSRGQGMPSFSTEPRIVMRTREGGKLEFVLRIPVPARDKGHAEQEILRGFLGAAPV